VTLRGRHERCSVCGREDVRGFSRLVMRRIRFKGGQKTVLEAAATWVCRPGYGCEGVGRLHVAFMSCPDVDEVP
jgi:hypothetical protein